MGFLREPSHLIIVAVVVLVLFGGKRLPDAARGLGRSMRIFKAEIKQMNEDDAPKTTAAEPLEGKVMTPEQRSAQRASETQRDV